MKYGILIVGLGLVVVLFIYANIFCFKLFDFANNKFNRKVREVTIAGICF